MARGTFTIQEIRRRGGSVSEAEIGDVFEWTSDARPNDAARGGARAAPLAPWSFGGELRTVRTDYPGAKTPSEQVLGPNHAEFSLRGRFDDRYNFPGYAVEEMRRFEALCRRGNMVRIQFQNQVFECLLTKWTFHYKRAWEIHYEFTVSNHDRPEDISFADRSPSTTVSAVEAFDDTDVIVRAAIETQENAPRSSLKGDLADRVDEDIVAMGTRRDSIGETLDQQGAELSGVIRPFKRLATQFRSAGATGSRIINTMIAVRSDLDLSVRTALSVLDFEEWGRSLRFQARLLMGTSSKAADDLEERDEPQAVSLYRAHEGESLYAISRRFYGTPHAWRLIADRNGLTDFILTGDELLIIPERGEG